MARKAYIGVGDAAKRIRRAYIGIDGKARKIKKIYIGVNGIAQLACELKQYTLSFAANGGTGSMSSIQTKEMFASPGEAIDSITVPSCEFTRSGYEFKWWVDGAGTKYEVGSKISLSGNTTLTAVWVQLVTINYTKTANLNYWASAWLGDVTGETGPVSKDGNPYYLRFKVTRYDGTVLNLASNLGGTFINDKGEYHVYSVQVPIDSTVEIGLVNKFSGDLCEIWRNGSRIAGPAEYITGSSTNYVYTNNYALTNLNVVFDWRTSGLIQDFSTWPPQDTRESWWVCGISTY